MEKKQIPGGKPHTVQLGDIPLPCNLEKPQIPGNRKLSFGCHSSVCYRLAVITHGLAVGTPAEVSPGEERNVPCAYIEGNSTERATLKKTAGESEAKASCLCCLCPCPSSWSVNFSLHLPLCLFQYHPSSPRVIAFHHLN